MTRLFLAPALSVLLGLMLLPLTLLFVISFWRVSSFRLRPDFSLEAWSRFFEVYGGLTLYSLLVGLAVAALCTLLGLAFACALRFHAGRAAEPILLIVLVTLFGGYLVKIYAWKTILGETGLINQALLGLGLIDQPLTLLLYSRTAVLIALVHFCLPFAILPLYSALRNIQPASIEAARDLGAGRWQSFTLVVLPQCRAGLAAAFGFIFLLASADYLTPLLLGGSGGSMLGQFIAQEFSTRFNWPAGAAMSFGLLLASLAVLALGWILLARPWKTSGGAIGPSPHSTEPHPSSRRSMIRRKQSQVQEPAAPGGSARVEPSQGRRPISA